MIKFMDLHGRRTKPTEDEQREIFKLWFSGMDNYREVRRVGGGEVLEPADAFALFARRWLPVGKTDTSQLPHPWN
ncbi:hypothetical protein ACWDSF_03320 [Nocardia beijingensis]